MVLAVVHVYLVLNVNADINPLGEIFPKSPIKPLRPNQPTSLNRHLAITMSRPPSYHEDSPYATGENELDELYSGDLEEQQ